MLINNLKTLIIPPLRFARKTFNLNKSYGEKPFISEEDFREAVESVQFEYKKIRFPQLWESDSPLSDPDVDRFANYIMKGGRKYLAYKLMDETFFHIKEIQLRRHRKKLLLEDKTASQAADEEEIILDPLVIFKKALTNVKPYVITKKVKRGGALYQVPHPLSADQSEYIAIKWMINAVLERPKPRLKKFPEVLAQELIEASQDKGKVIKKRDDMHRLADANKAYAHYRWG